METKVKHTPGPWTVRAMPRNYDYRIEAGLEFVVDLHATMATGRTFDANANLIAAAPDLLEACNRFLRAQDEGDMDGLKRAAMLASRAVSKAEGEAQ